MTSVFAGVVSIRGNDGGVVIDWGGVGKGGGLLNNEVLPCAGLSLVKPNRGDGACFPNVFPGCDTFDDENAILSRNGFEKSGEFVEPDV